MESCTTPKDGVVTHSLAWSADWHPSTSNIDWSPREARWWCSLGGCCTAWSRSGERRSALRTPSTWSATRSRTHGHAHPSEASGGDKRRAGNVFPIAMHQYHEREGVVVLYEWPKRESGARRARRHATLLSPAFTRPRAAPRTAKIPLDRSLSVNHSQESTLQSDVQSVQSSSVKLT